MEKRGEIAVFGAGCFWCTEAIFKRLKGVTEVTPGFSGGTKENPTYEEVCEGNTGHAEVSRIEFNPREISYEELLEVFFNVHDPTSLNRQGADVGTQYRSAIFYDTPEQKKLAEEVLKRTEERKIYPRKIVTEIKPLETFYEAESYHSDYYAKNGYAPYCQFVIRPKVESFQEKYRNLLK